MYSVLWKGGVQLPVRLANVDCYGLRSRVGSRARMLCKACCQQVSLQYACSGDLGHKVTQLKMKLQYIKFSLVFLWEALQSLESLVIFRHHLCSESNFRVAATFHNNCSL